MNSSNRFDPFFVDLRRDLGASSTLNLGRAKQTLESLQKRLEIATELRPEELQEACNLFGDFLAQHQTDSSIEFQLTHPVVLQDLYERFRQLHQKELDTYFSQFIPHLMRHLHDDICRKSCIEYLIALGLLEEIRQGENLSQGKFAILIHYYTKAFKLTKESPEYLPTLRELSSAILLRILKYSFQHYASQILAEELSNSIPELRGFKRYVTVLGQLKELNIASHDHLRELYDLPRNLLRRSRIPDHLKNDVGLLLDDIQTQISALVLGTQASNSFIEQLQVSLCSYREEFQNAFDHIYAEQIKKPDPEKVRTFQKERFEAFQTFFKETLFRGFLFAFEPQDLPPYDLRAVGSVGRQELSPYSDLECFVLVEKDSLPLLRALNLLQLELICFGETVADLPGISKDFFDKGLFLDPFDPSEDAPLLIENPKSLAFRQKDSDDEQHYTQEDYSLLRSSSLSCNQSTLFDSYSDFMQEIMRFVPEPSFLDRMLPSHEDLKPLHQKRAARLIATFIKDNPLSDHSAIIDIKADFLTPLSYLITCLGIYFNIEETNTLDILDRLGGRAFFDPTSARLIKEVVATLYLIRLQLHFSYQKGCDEALLHLNSERMGLRLLTEQQKGWLDCAKELVLRPLYEALQEGHLPEWIDLLAPVRFKALDRQYALNHPKPDRNWMAFFRAYVRYLIDTDRQETVETLYLYLSSESRFEPLRYEIYCLARTSENSLFSIPNEQTGFRYSSLQQFEELQNRLMGMTLSLEELEHLSPTGPKVQMNFIQWDEALIPLYCCGQTGAAEVITRYLHPSLVNALLDEEAQQKALNGQLENGQSTLWLKRHYPKSLHRVVPLSMAAGKSLHFKERPTHTSMEFAVVSLLNRLFGRGVTPSILARLTIELPNGQAYPTAVAISLSQNGKTLSELIKQPSFQTDHRFDPEQYSEQLISHVLILPTDAHGGNFLVNEQNPHQLIALDLEASFVPLRLGNTKEIDFVSELFCHPVISHLSTEVMRSFIHIKTSELLTAWLTSSSTF